MSLPWDMAKCLRASYCTRSHSVDGMYMDVAGSLGIVFVMDKEGM